jgi:3-hydroxyisobutyrate dehydrogenase-like beta-hydroxyacid dehydrogenase/ABC-type branched-subunit amino acid transport system substrate-binding protein
MVGDDDARRLGWLGTGRMGVEMGRRLLSAGCDLAVFNRSMSKAEPLIQLGAKPAGTAAELAARDIVFITVGSSDDLISAVLGPDGLMSGSGAAPRVLIDCSTVSAEASARVRAEIAHRGTALLAAPVMGNPKVVRAGKMTAAVSGPRDAFDLAEPYLNMLGRGVTYVGDGEVARTVKLCHNLLLGVVAQSLAEITVLAEKSGISRQAFLECLNKSVMGSLFTGYKTPAYVNLDFEPTFTATLLRKDFDLGLAAAREHEVPMPVAAVVHQLIQGLVGRGYGDADFAALLQQQADSAGLMLVSEHAEVSDGLGTSDTLSVITRTRRKEAPGVRPHLPRLSKNCLALSAAAVLSAGVVAACSSSGSSTSSTSTSTSSSPSTKAPITIGASLSLTGDFSDDGQAFQRGYQLWASDVNKSGGLLGRQVTLKILNDNSSPTQASTNYQTLFASDKVDLAFGPFSSLLTTPSASVAARYGYALIEGAGGAPSVFNSPANQSAHNIFDVSLPIEDEMIPFVNWVASLPPSQRPKTAAYPMADDPFADPPVQLAQQKLAALGVRTVYSKIFPAENASYKPAADQVAATGAQAVLLGSTDVPTVAAFMQAFEQQHYNPMMFICAAGPDQGASFTSAVGKGNATGMMVPNGWYPGYQSAASQQMVQEYVAKYHGSPSDINADVAEAYAVGQVAAQAVKATGGTDNAKIITYLHSGVTLSTVQGPVKFDELGKNSAAAAFVFQWQKDTTYKQVLPTSAAGSVPIVNPKPNWTS